jgi:hypothetical protein
MDGSMTPDGYCAIWDPVEVWKCASWWDEWQLYWYDSNDDQVPSVCHYIYEDGWLVGYTCNVPITTVPIDEYRGVLCRTEFPSSACVETLEEFYFKVTG